MGIEEDDKYTLRPIITFKEKCENKTFFTNISSMTSVSMDFETEDEEELDYEQFALLIETIMTPEMVERLKNIEKMIVSNNDKKLSEEEKKKTLDSALVTLQLEGNFEMFKDAIHNAISGIDNIPTFMVYDNREEVGIANNFKDIVTVVDRTFKNKFNKTFYELVGIDVYTSRYQLLELLFNKVRIERCNGYVYILK